MPTLILSLLTLGVLLTLFSRHRLQTLGIPAGRLVSLDTSRLKPGTETLYDPDLGLTGRPDYLIQRGRSRIPVEVKSGRAPEGPHRSHVLQLAAYCQLVETATGKRPPYGILKYADCAYKLPYNHALRRDFSNTLRALRNAQDSSPDRSHSSPGKCRACGYLSSCDQSLV
jgi:CRISPR-associated exonuclease Cas4